MILNRTPKIKKAKFLIVLNCELTNGESVRLSIIEELEEDYIITTGDAAYFVENYKSIKEFKKDRYIMTNQIVSVELDGFTKE